MPVQMQIRHYTKLFLSYSFRLLSKTHFFLVNILWNIILVKHATVGINPAKCIEKNIGDKIFPFSLSNNPPISDLFNEINFPTQHFGITTP